MRDGFLETSDIRDAIIEMADDGYVLVGDVNTKGQTLRYVKRAYRANAGLDKDGHPVLILELDNFVPYKEEPNENVDRPAHPGRDVEPPGIKPRSQEESIRGWLRSLRNG